MNTYEWTIFLTLIGIAYICFSILSNSIINRAAYVGRHHISKDTEPLYQLVARLEQETRNKNTSLYETHPQVLRKELFS